MADPIKDIRKPKHSVPLSESVKASGRLRPGNHYPGFCSLDASRIIGRGRDRSSELLDRAAETIIIPIRPFFAPVGTLSDIFDWGS